MSNEKPSAITVHRGRVYLSNARHHRIQVNDATGGFRATFGTFGGGPGQFNAPGGLAVDQRGRLWVAVTNDSIYVVDDDQLIKQFANPFRVNAQC